MKTLIIYKTSTGHTQQYAKMLSQKISCEAVSLDQMAKINIENYDILIFGGWVRATQIVGLRKFIKKIAGNSKQKIVIFAVGANQESDKNTNDLMSKNMEGNNISYPLFYLQGGFDPDKLKFPIRIMLNKVAKSIKKRQIADPESLSREDKDFLEFFQGKHDETDENHLLSLIDYINNLEN